MSHSLAIQQRGPEPPFVPSLTTPITRSSRKSVAVKVEPMQSPESRAVDHYADCLRAIGKTHDRSAFESVFRFYAPRIKAVLMKSGARPEEAEEVMQETLVLVWRKAEQFDPAKASASTWIYTIARNRRIDLLRKTRRPELDPDDPFFTDSLTEPDGEQNVHNAERAEIVQNYIKTLPKEQLLVIQKAFFEDKTHQEIASELQIPLGTVKSRIRIAMRSMRDQLEKVDL